MHARRRDVLALGAVTALGGGLGTGCGSAGGSGGSSAARRAADAAVPGEHDPDATLIVSTWDFGARANAVAWERLQAGVEHPLEAAEAGARESEADASIPTVGLGGRPNAAGVVELDAAIMRGDTVDCGAVAALVGVAHPISVARAVMERSPHVFLVGDGAGRFAREQGFSTGDLLTEGARADYEAWLERQERPAPGDDHDTLGLIVREAGRFAVAVTSSGAAFKHPGRSGDAPVVGAGGYCDDAAGACVSTGLGEEVIRTCGSFAVVEAMRHGADPTEACRLVSERILRNLRLGGREASVAFLAVDRHGRVGATYLGGEFPYARTDARGTEMLVGEEVRPS